ncbi:UPF0182 family membrane protein [Solicola gregarius]|uniref:UPF0182 protein L0C25_03145 n=1 Tax=Solicola gregarius TaxID=2908642 RepID=A0AA46TKG8_9ACTN|nr:UPF0182 family protein [Solicola gregarius]UYM06083.1 UPF0182 family protein [Solicola gregarius]
MSDGFAAGSKSDEEPPASTGRGRRVLIPTIITLAVLIFLASIFTGIWTDRLWFQALDYGSVYSTLLGTRVVLFLIFGLVFAGVVLGSVYLAYRCRPPLAGQARISDPVARYRDGIDPVRKPLFIVLGIALVGFSGAVAVGKWETYLLWRNGGSFGQDDEYFGKDIGFFVFDYPWFRFLASYGFALLIVAMILTALVYYLYGAISFQARVSKVSTAARVHLSIMIGVFMLLKAFAYWLDRYGFATADGSLHTGISYTDAHARIPSKNILIVIALICAILFFVNAVRGSWMLPGIGVGLLLLSSILIGGIWPAIMQSFQVKPSEQDKESPYIEKNITATRDAYDIGQVQVEDYDATTTVDSAELRESSETRVSTRLLDPTLVAPAFEQLQQVRGYYTVPDTLDIDRYTIDESDQPQDLVIAARELDLSGLQDSQRTWTGDHTVYTHGYGVIAARGNQVNAEGEPVWVEQDIPPRGEFEFKKPPRIYYGEAFGSSGGGPDYSIVGAPEGTNPVEIDIPTGGGEDDTESSTQNTYDGKGGVEVGSTFRQLLYAAKFGEPNILLSGRVNSDSKILYDRDPRHRVEKVAPWLEVDGDPYPAVVDGRVVWIVDGYTTSDDYPLSEKRSMEEATSDTLTNTGAQEALPTDQVNYVRNSVKAVVDAYDGTVDMYQWDTEDPLLDAWMKTFPDIVKPKSEIPETLMEHLRYPVDLYKLQRDVLERYHVTDADTFYQDDERWVVPQDPTSSTGEKQPPYYLSMARPGEKTPNFSLTSVYVPNNRENLGAFMSVDSEATSKNYGSFQILQLSSEQQIPGPNQMDNTFANDDGVRGKLLSFTNNSSVEVLYGNLLSLPIGDALLYVQPVYTQNTGTSGSYPVLQLVVASFGEDVGSGKDLDEALRDALGIGPDTDTDGDDDSGTNTPPDVEATARDLVDQAVQAFSDAQAALDDGDLSRYQTLNDKAGRLLEQAKALMDGEQPPDGGSNGENGGNEGDSGDSAGG